MADPVVDPQPADNPSDWKTGLPDDIRGDPSLAAIKDLPALAKSYIHAQKLVGMDKLPVPAKDATPEAWNEFYTKLGKPEAPDKYELNEVKYPEGYPVNPEIVKEFRTKAHELHLLPAQVKALHEWYVTKELATWDSAGKINSEEAEKFQKDSQAEMKKEWGEAYDGNLKKVQTLVKSIGGKDFAAYLEATRLGDSPAMIRFLHKIAAEYPEDKLVMGDVAGVTPAGKAGAIREISRVNADKTHPYWNEGPGHKEAVAEMTRLSAIAYGK